MKKSLTKLIVSCAAVTAVAAAMAISASAADFTAEYDAEHKLIKPDSTATLASTGENTILVIEGDGLTGLQAAIENNSLIKYINQANAKDAAEWLTKIPADLEVDENGKVTKTYTVFMGGQDATEINKAVLKPASAGGGETGETEVVLKGDVDRDGDPTSLDALAVLEHEVQLHLFTDPNDVLVADVDDDGDATSLDALAILEHEIQTNLITDTVTVPKKTN